MSAQHQYTPLEDLEGFTSRIRAADSPEAERELLVQKQAALELRHPRREPTEPTPEPVIQDPNLRKMYERSRAKEQRRSSYPVAKRAAVQQSPRRIAKKVAATPGKSPKLDVLNPAKLTAQEPNNLSPLERQVSTTEPGAEAVKYANGRAMTQTAMSVSVRPDLSAKAKSVALMLAAHAPHVRPRVERLMLLTGIKSNNTVNEALQELKRRGLLTWRRGNSTAANSYQCLWLTPSPESVPGAEDAPIASPTA